MIAAAIQRNLRGSLAVLGAAIGSAVAVRASSSESVMTEAEKAPSTDNAAPKKAPQDWLTFELTNKCRVNHDTLRYHLAPHGHDSKLDSIQPPFCISVRADVLDSSDGKPTIAPKLGMEGTRTIVRPYTPVNNPAADGTVELMVKTYEKGGMSQALSTANTGDVVGIKGPYPKYKYVPGKHRRLILIAGGSGITPMYQLLQHIFFDTLDETEITLIFANKDEDDILLRSELDAFTMNYPQFRVYHVLSQPTGHWDSYRGHLSKEMLEEMVPTIREKNGTMVMVCGPPGMMESVCGNKDKQKQGPVTGLLSEMGYDSNGVYKF